jgi:hypothetical protein
MQIKHILIVIFTILLIAVILPLMPAPSCAQDSQEYRRRANVLRQAVQRCNERISSRELTSCTVEVGFGINRTVSMSEALKIADDFDRRAREFDREGEKRWCVSVRDRYIRDMEAIRRMQKTIQMGQQELEEWARKNEEAQWNALKAALNLLVDGGLGYLAESTQTLNGLKGALTKYENQLKRQKKKIDPLQQAKWMDMEKRIVEMEMAMNGAKQLQNKKEKAEIFWGYFTSSAEEVDKSMDSFKTALNTVDEDPLLHKILTDKGPQPMVGRLKIKYIMPKKPYLLNMLEFAKDYGYSSWEWIESRDRIIQQYDVSDQQLKAVNAMQEEIKRTMASLNDCIAKGLVARP